MNEEQGEATVIPFPPLYAEPANLKCGRCGGEWWKAVVVFSDEPDWTHIAGWRARVECNECGAERDLYEEA